MDDFTPQERDVTVVELLDRLVDHGVVLSGDIKISVADVDLIEIGLRLLIRTPLLEPSPEGEPMSFRREDGEPLSYRRKNEGPDDFTLRLRASTERD